MDFLWLLTFSVHRLYTHLKHTIVALKVSNSRKKFSRNANVSIFQRIFQVCVQRENNARCDYRTSKREFYVKYRALYFSFRFYLKIIKRFRKHVPLQNFQLIIRIKKKPISDVVLPVCIIL